jgi:hypothetical protein
MINPIKVKFDECCKPGSHGEIESGNHEKLPINSLELDHVPQRIFAEALRAW